MIEKYKKVYFSGIGGIGVSALAKMFLARGVEVLGSDVEKSQTTLDLENKGIKVFYEQKQENITRDLDLMIFSPAVPEDNPERKKAAALDIQQKSYPEVLGELSKIFKTIAVCGTNGKSTTTAMISNILIDAKIDPTVIVGSKIDKIDGNFRAGKSDYFVVEACEYRAHMLNLTPRAIVMTNIEEDHLDYYRDIEHIRQTFQEFIDKLESIKKGILVINNDDLNSTQLHLPDCRAIVSYGINNEADVRASKIKVENGRQKFNVEYRGEELGEFELQVPGKFNVYNALAAISLSLSLEVRPETIKSSLKNFHGIWRRFEKVYDKEVTVVCDYAHHPTAVQNTILAAKEFYPQRRIVAVFQPHHYNRTEKLFDDFVISLGAAEVIILPEIYNVVGRGRFEQKISSRDLVREIKNKWPEKKVLFSKDLSQTLDLVNFNIQENDVVLVMGAGSVYKICDKIEYKKKG